MELGGTQDLSLDLEQEQHWMSALETVQRKFQLWHEAPTLEHLSDQTEVLYPKHSKGIQRYENQQAAKTWKLRLRISCWESSHPVQDSIDCVYPGLL